MAQAGKLDSQIGVDISGGTVHAQNIAGRDIIINHSSEARPLPSRAESQARRNRLQAIMRVRFNWIEGVLQQSLYKVARIELGFTDRSDAVEWPLDMLVQRQGQSRHLPPGTRISTVFDEELGQLLILGAPGSGKTTLLLELTQELLKRAENDETRPIPMVFNLSSWALDRQPLVLWLIDEMNKRYDIPRNLAKAWMEQEQILPLLDGLDEVALEHRQSCVDAINIFRKRYGLLPIAVCSRIEEYESLTLRLRLSGAVAVQPLSRTQIQNYLDRIGDPVKTVRTVLETDPKMWELLDTPLMLSIAMLSYGGCDLQEIKVASTLIDQRDQLFAKYVDTMFERRSKMNHPTKDQTIRWLAWLSFSMIRLNQSVFDLESLDQKWLTTRTQQWIFRLGFGLLDGLIIGPVLGLIEGLIDGPIDGLIMALVVALIAGPVGALIGGRRGGLMIGFITGPVIGLAVGLSDGSIHGLAMALFYGSFGAVIGVIFGWVVGGLVFGEHADLGFGFRPVDTFRWSWRTVRHGLPLSLGLGLLAGLLYSLDIGLRGGVMRGGLFGALRGGLIIGLFTLLAGLAGTIRESTREIPVRSSADEGTRRSARNAAVFGLVGGLLGVAIAGLFGGVMGGMVAGLGVGLGTGLVFSFPAGGSFCIQQVLVRLILWHRDFAPQRLVRFLNCTVDRIFLRKVGGGYIFVHRMLMEYFAAQYRPDARNGH